MAISTTNAINGPYTTNGATTVFPFTFTAISAVDVSVLIRTGTTDADGTNYTVTLTPGGGGYVTFDSAPASGSSLYVLLSPDFTQDTEFEQGGPYLARAHNVANDRSALRDQVLKREIDRAILFPIGDDGVRLPLATARATKYMGFDAAGAFSLKSAPTVTYAAGAAVNSRDLLAGLDSPFHGQLAYLTEAGREGSFLYWESDAYEEVYGISTADGVASDELQGVYVPLTSDPDGTEGAWVRMGDTLTPGMFGGVQSYQAGNRILESPPYTEVVVDATEAVQAVFDVIKAHDNREFMGDFTGFWGISDPDAYGIGIHITQPYYAVRTFIMGHFAVVSGASMTSVFKVHDASYNHTARGRWEVWGQPDQLADHYTNRTCDNCIEARTMSLWNVESIYARGFKRWGVYEPLSPSDATYNQNIGAKFSRVKATYCGSDPRIPAARAEFTYSDGSKDGSVNSLAQRWNVTLVATLGELTDLQPDDKLVIDGLPYTIKEIDTDTGEAGLFPWPPAPLVSSGTALGLFGGGFHNRGSDTSAVTIDVLDVLNCGIGLLSQSLYGINVNTCLIQGSGIGFLCGSPAGNTLGNNINYLHSEGNQFDLVGENETLANVHIGTIASIANDDFDRPFKNSLVIQANDGNGYNRSTAFAGWVMNINGTVYASGSGPTGSRVATSVIGNAPDRNDVVLTGEAASVLLSYDEAAERLFGMNNGRLRVVGGTELAPSGEIRLALAPEDNASAWQASHAYVPDDYVTNDNGRVYRCIFGGTSAGSGGPTGNSNSYVTDNGVTWLYWRPFSGLTINGSTDDYVIDAGDSKAMVDLEFFLDTVPILDGDDEPVLDSEGRATFTRDWRVVNKGGITVEGKPGMRLNQTQADITLLAGEDEITQLWNAPFTEDIAVILSETGVKEGAKFRIARTGAGAFNLSVPCTPSVNLAASQWCEVQYDGSDWFLVAKGSL